MILSIIVIIISLAMSFFFSGAETAMISVNQYNLRHKRDQGDPEAAKTLALLAKISSLMSAVLIGVSLGETFLTLFFKLVLDHLWPSSHQFVFGSIRRDELVSLLILTPVMVVFAEILPKALFRAKADAWIHAIRPMLALSMFVFAPVIKSLDILLNFFLAPFGGKHRQDGPRLTRSDLILMLNAPPAPGATESAEGNGTKPVEAASSAAQAAPESTNSTPISLGVAQVPEEGSDERRLIQNIIGLEQTQVREIMQPLIALEAVRLGRTTKESFLEQARRSGYSRFPVYEKRIMNLTGFIDLYDVLRDGEAKLESCVRPAYYVPETKRVDDLLQEFLIQRINNAIVVDEYGGCSGWVTREDILEEIVGELDDELDEPIRFINELPEGGYLIDGRAHSGAVDEALGTTFEDDHDCGTLGGFLMKHLGRVAKVGDSLVLEGWPMEVIAMDGLRIAHIRVHPRPVPESETPVAS